MNTDLPPPPRRDGFPPRQDAQSPAQAQAPIWKRWWFWLAVVVVIATIGTAVGGGEGGIGTDSAASDCLLPASAWLDTLETAFYPEFQDASGGITS